MRLILDMGNSRLGWATHEGDAWHVGQPIDLTTSGIEDRLSASWGQLAPVSVWLSSVGRSELTEQIQDWIHNSWSLEAVQIQAAPEAAGVRNCYAEPATLGSDRWAALIAVANLFSTPACIVDCGTAVTVDAIDTGGQFRGGVILPGLGLMRQGLNQGTQLDDRLGDAGNCLACTTADGVAAGTLFGLAGAIDRIVANQLVELGEGATVYLTGGDARAVQPLLQTPVERVDDLVLIGIRTLVEQTS